MRVKLNPKAYLYPQPVLIIGTYDENGVPDAMNAAWGGVSDSSEISMCLSSSHKTVKNILLKKEFSVSMGTKSQMIQCDYVGMVSGNSTKDKIKKTGWTVTKSDVVDAPIFEELPLTLECKLVSYDRSSGILKGEVVGVSVDQSILTNNKIDVDKLEAISYDSSNHTYVLVKGIVGNAFSDGNKIR